MTKPNLIPKVKPYLTIIEDRRPVQKMHSSLGHAKNAFTFDRSRAGTLWEWKDGDWSLLHTITRKRTNTDYYSGWKQSIPWHKEKK